MDEGTIFMRGLTPRIRCGANATQLLQWATDFFGPKLGSEVPTLYKTLRPPIPQCGKPPPANLEYDHRDQTGGSGASLLLTRSRLLAT